MDGMYESPVTTLDTQCHHRLNNDPASPVEN